MDKFTLSINLGNDAMRNGSDVAQLLAELAVRISTKSLRHEDGGKVRDLNGNTVGEWEVT